jgi:hypothetical protein
MYRDIAVVAQFSGVSTGSQLGSYWANLAANPLTQYLIRLSLPSAMHEFSWIRERGIVLLEDDARCTVCNPGVVGKVKMCR